MTNRITNKISTMLSLATSDMPVYVKGDMELAADIRKGWEGRVITVIDKDAADPEVRSLTIRNENSFSIIF